MRDHSFRTLPAPLDRALQLDDDDQVRDWCSHLQVSEERLRAAAALVGRMPAALAYYLQSSGGKTKTVSAEMRLNGPAQRPRRKLVSG